jgi:hypothetical protein
MVIGDLAWHRFDFQLRGGWVDWENPVMFANAGKAWTTFLAAQRDSYPNIEEDLAPAISQLEEVWVLRLRYGFEFLKEYQFQCGTPPPAM